MAKRVVVFSQPCCIFCKQTKEFFLQRGIPFEERDVSKDLAAWEEVLSRGLMVTPVTVIDDEVVAGFDQEKLTAMLDLAEIAKV